MTLPERYFKTKTPYQPEGISYERVKITGNDSSFLKTLAEHIAAQLDERAFCVVFEDKLERCWPSNPMAQAERNSEIQRFSESQGWRSAQGQYFKNWVAVTNDPLFRYSHRLTKTIFPY
jgi:hypothetical protein